MLCLVTIVTRIDWQRSVAWGEMTEPEDHIDWKWDCTDVWIDTVLLLLFFIINCATVNDLRDIWIVCRLTFTTSPSQSAGYVAASVDLKVSWNQNRKARHNILQSLCLWNSETNGMTVENIPCKRKKKKTGKEKMKLTCKMCFYSNLPWLLIKKCLKLISIQDKTNSKVLTLQTVCLSYNDKTWISLISIKVFLLSQLLGTLNWVHSFSINSFLCDPLCFLYESHHWNKAWANLTQFWSLLNAR